MWNTVMAVNSFFFWPISFIFLIYSVGHAILFLEWKMFIIAIVFFAITTGGSVVIGILNE